MQINMSLCIIFKKKTVYEDIIFVSEDFDLR